MPSRITKSRHNSKDRNTTRLRTNANGPCQTTTRCVIYRLSEHINPYVTWFLSLKQKTLIYIIVLNLILLLIIFRNDEKLAFAVRYGMGQMGYYNYRDLIEKRVSILPRKARIREKLLLDGKFQEKLSKLDDFYKNKIYDEIFLNENVFVSSSVASQAPANFKIENNQIKRKRLPNVICLGAKKCGTGAFQRFMSYHSKFKSANIDEPHFFDQNEKYKQGVNYYSNFFPDDSSTDDIIFEKTPKYIAVESVPKRIKNFYEKILDYNNENNYYENLKFIVVLCNPVNRAWSDYNHVKFMNNTWINQLSKFENFDEYVKHTTKETKRNDKVHNATYVLQTSESPLSMVTKGLYIQQLRHWMKYFNLKQFIFIDGDNLVTSPSVEIIKAQKALGLDIEITNRDFIFNKETGFYCFLKTGKDCLGKGKGRTRSKNGLKMSLLAESELTDYYREFNQDLYRLIKRDFDW